MCHHQPPCAAKDPAPGAHECCPPRLAGSARTELAFGDVAIQLSGTNPVPARRGPVRNGLIGMPEISDLAATARLHDLSDKPDTTARTGRRRSERDEPT